MADFNEDKRKQEKAKGDGVNADSICCDLVVYLNVGACRSP